MRQFAQDIKSGAYQYLTLRFHLPGCINYGTP